MALSQSEIQSLYQQLLSSGVGGMAANDIIADVNRDGWGALQRSIQANAGRGNGYDANAVLGNIQQSQPNNQNLFQQPQAPAPVAPQAPAQPQVPDTFGLDLFVGKPATDGQPAQQGLVPGSRFPTLPFDQEARAYKGISELEQADLFRARDQQKMELEAYQGLFDQAGLQDQGEYQQAAQQALQQGNDLFGQNLALAQSSLAPIFQEQLKKNAAALRAKQGLGAGGFDGSGAYQQLAGQNSTQLALEAYKQAFPGLFNAQQASQSLNTQGQLARQPYRQAGVQNRLEIGNLFANAGVNANLTPSQYRRDLFQRGLDENARLADVGGQYEFVDKQAGLANSAASQARKAGVNAALIGGLGAIGGGLATGYASNLFKPRV